MSAKMKPEEDLSQFHHCKNCEAGEDEVVGAHEAVLEDFRERGLSPRESVMTLTSLVCNYIGAQEDPIAALEETLVAIQKLFEKGQEEIAAMDGRDPHRKSLVH